MKYFLALLFLPSLCLGAETRYNVGQLVEPVRINTFVELKDLVIAYEWPLNPTLDFEEKALIGESLLTAQEFVASLHEIKPFLSKGPILIEWNPHDSVFKLGVVEDQRLRMIHPAHIPKHKFAEVDRFLQIFKDASLHMILKAMDGKK